MKQTRRSRKTRKITKEASIARRRRMFTLSILTLVSLSFFIIVTSVALVAAVGIEAKEVDSISVATEPIRRPISEESQSVSETAQPVAQAQVTQPTVSPNIPASTVEAVIKQYDSAGVAVPIMIDYMGMWIDQRGEKMFKTDAEWYFKGHLDYCAAALAANRQLNHHPQTMDEPDDEYDRIEQILGDYGPARGEYPFITEKIAEYREDGTHILMAMSPYQLDSVKAYMRWSGYQPELVPMMRTSEGWFDQFGKEMADEKVQEFFAAHPGYEDTINAYIQAARDTGMIESINIMQAGISYSNWFMFQARQAEGISEQAFTHTSFSEKVGSSDTLWDIETLITHLVNETEKLLDWHN